jgi:hypothetical protein
MQSSVLAPLSNWRPALSKAWLQSLEDILNQSCLFFLQAGFRGSKARKEVTAMRLKNDEMVTHKLLSKIR